MSFVINNHLQLILGIKEILITICQLIKNSNHKFRFFFSDFFIKRALEKKNKKLKTQFHPLLYFPYQPPFKHALSPKQIFKKVQWIYFFLFLKFILNELTNHRMQHIIIYIINIYIYFLLHLYLWRVFF